MDGKGFSYKEYKQGRRFLVRIQSGESLVGRISDLVNAEQIQAVQQLAALQVIGLAQIQFQPALPGFRRQTQPLLLALQIQLQGQHRRMLRHHTQALADQ